MKGILSFNKGSSDASEMTVNCICRQFLSPRIVAGHSHFCTEIHNSGPQTLERMSIVRIFCTTGCVSGWTSSKYVLRPQKSSHVVELLHMHTQQDVSALRLFLGFLLIEVPC
jgi:hypothetical protein